jgi:surface carbohydrate biosynthesis protein
VTDTKVNVLFPVETLNRELDWRLVLACIHASSSNRIFVGQHDALYRMVMKGGMQGGVYVGKGLFRDLPMRQDHSRYRAMKQKQFVLIQIHEEEAIMEGDENFWRRVLVEESFDPRCLEAEDYVCTWGDFQRDFYRGLKPACAEHIVTTGHPRFDIMKPGYRKYFEPEAAGIRARFGDFILINTNFSSGNNCLGLADSFSRRVGFDVENPARRSHRFSRYAYELRLMGDFIKLTNQLSLKFPDVNIVLRPHPSEDLNYYRTVFKDIRNVHVIHEGAVIPWLLACRMLIHNGCTTGMEAYFTDTDVINYKPAADPKHDIFLPNLFGVECFDEEAVIRNVSAMLEAGNMGPPQERLDARARSLMANFGGDSIRAFLQVLEDVEARQARVSQRWSAWRTRRAELSRQIVDGVKLWVRPLFPFKQRQYRAMRSHFTGLDPNTVTRKIRTLESITGKKFALTFYSSELLSIEVAT